MNSRCSEQGTVLKQREYRSVMVDEPIKKNSDGSRDMSIHETPQTQGKLHEACTRLEGTFSFDLNWADY